MFIFSRLFLFIFMMISGFVSAEVQAPSITTTNFGACLSAALDKKFGRVVKVEFKQQDGKLIYEFDVRARDARDWDIECLEETAQIIELEEEVMSPRHERFFSKMKVSLNKARQTALMQHPGEVLEVEYELEDDQFAVYEFDIKRNDSTIVKIEINAETGLVHEESVELWQIGYE